MFLLLSQKKMCARQIKADLNASAVPTFALLRASCSQSLPLTAAPEVFGLHDNASITRAQSETVQLLKSVLLTESSGGGSGGSDKETTISTVAADILWKVKEANRLMSQTLNK